LEAVKTLAEVGQKRLRLVSPRMFLYCTRKVLPKMEVITTVRGGGRELRNRTVPDQPSHAKRRSAVVRSVRVFIGHRTPNGNY